MNIYYGNLGVPVIFYAKSKNIKQIKKLAKCYRIKSFAKIQQKVTKSRKNKNQNKNVKKT